MKFQILLLVAAVIVLSYANQEEYGQFYDGHYHLDDCGAYCGEGCCYNTVIYERGESWPSDLYCLNVSCYGKNHTIVTGCEFVRKECSTGFVQGLQFPHCCPINKCAFTDQVFE